MTPDNLLPQVYGELRKLAASKLKSEQPGQTLSATALVHEAWLRLSEASVDFQDRTHFFRTAATAMRRILMDRARAKSTKKRDGGMRVTLDDPPDRMPDEQLLAIDEAISALAVEKPDHAKLVELRFIVGLTGDEAAEVMSISPATADRMWRYARAWLQVHLEK
ncbi:MAG: sigma-70 family RNA polymerase sigma factor [Planctomycetia bacterium]|nr:sigma-70 family RNA polymerase sigma factor [Planctomycetia bacterium]